MLKEYLPETVVEDMENLLRRYSCRLLVVSERRTVYGNYRAMPDGSHRITVNRGLDKWAFFLVLLHEAAHMQTRVKYGGAVRPHGQEWKESYRSLLRHYIYSGVFPPALASLVYEHSRNPKAFFPTEIRTFLKLNTDI